MLGLGADGLRLPACSETRNRARRARMASRLAVVHVALDADSLHSVPGATSPQKSDCLLGLFCPEGHIAHHAATGARIVGHYETSLHRLTDVDRDGRRVVL